MKNSIRFPHLTRSPFLADLPGEIQTEFLDACRIRTVEPEQEFLSQGQTSENLYLIAHGVVQISYDNEQGQSTLIGFDGAGDVLGELEAIADQVALASCHAFKPLVLLEMPKNTLMEFMKNPIFLRNYARVQLRRFLRDNELKAADHFYTVDQKLCSHLLNLSLHTNTIDQNQASLAQAIGCTRQTINKELNALKSLGIIDIRKGGVNILQREKLAERLP